MACRGVCECECVCVLGGALQVACLCGERLPGAEPLPQCDPRRRCAPGTTVPVQGISAWDILADFFPQLGFQGCLFPEEKGSKGSYFNLLHFVIEAALAVHHQHCC